MPARSFLRAGSSLNGGIRNEQKRKKGGKAGASTHQLIGAAEVTDYRAFP